MANVNTTETGLVTLIPRGGQAAENPESRFPARFGICKVFGHNCRHFSGDQSCLQILQPSGILSSNISGFLQDWRGIIISKTVY